MCSLSGDMLGGHLDDMEKDWTKPIVSMRYSSCSFCGLSHHLCPKPHVSQCVKICSSISLGCKAIFLLGGKSREDPPIAMFLRSGDAVLMAGEARECFHGSIITLYASFPASFTVIYIFQGIKMTAYLWSENNSQIDLILKLYVHSYINLSIYA